MMFATINTPVLRRLFTLCSLTCGLIFTPLAHSANSPLSLSLAEPRWSFLIDNQMDQSDVMQLASAERTFARTLQPLLAEQKYKDVAALLKERSDEEDSAAMSLLRGQVLLSINDIKGAEKALKKATEKAPQQAGAHRSLALVYMQQKRYSEARVHQQKALELGLNDAQLYGQLAFTNLQLNNAAAAVAGYRQALFLQADNNEWARGLLYALTQSQALDQAQALVEELLQQQSDKRELWMIRSQIAMQQERPLQALSSLENAVALGEKEPSNLATAARLHLRHGSPQRAVELLTLPAVMKTQIDTTLADNLVQTASWLVHEQQWQTLNKLLQATAKANLPDSAKAGLNVSRAYMALNKKDNSAAEKALRTALENLPTSGDALLALADLLRDQQRHQQAIMYYLRAEALSAYRERALLGRAQLHINQREFNDALQLLTQVVRDNPQRTDLYANIRSLRNLVRNES